MATPQREGFHSDGLGMLGWGSVVGIGCSEQSLSRLCGDRGSVLGRRYPRWRRHLRDLP